MTLKEIIEIRQHKFDSYRRGIPIGGYWTGYCEGWYLAYKDLAEILEQNGFDLNTIVIKEIDDD